MKLSSKDRRSIVIGGGALIVIVLSRLVILPWIDDWQQTRDSISATQGELEDLERQVERATAQSRRLESTFGPGVCRDLADLPTSRVSLIKAVQQALQGAGLRATDWQNLPSRPIKEAPGLEYVPIEIRGVGQPQQLAAVLVAFQKHPQLILVHRLSVANKEKQPGQLEISMELATLAKTGAAQ